MSGFDHGFTAEELACFRETKALLIKSKGFDASTLDPRAIVLTAINCKLRADTACEKYSKLSVAMKEFGIESFHEVWKDVGRDCEYLVGSNIARLMNVYAPCGTDKQNRSIMWIRAAEQVNVADEADSVKAGVIYWTAIHSDFTSLRSGITFVLDTTSNDVEKVGNEAKMQRVYQSIPLRPQRIYILGAFFLKRLAINALIALTSLFTREKVLDRIRFAEIDEVRMEISEESLPVYVGGGGGEKSTANENVLWVKSRIKDFPQIPDF